MTRSYLLPAITGMLTFGAFSAGVFFRGLDEAIFTPALLAVLGMAGILLAGGWRDAVRGWDIPVGRMAGFLALFWLWLVIALSWSQVPQVSGIFTLLIGAMPLLFFATTQHPRAVIIARAQVMAIAGVMVLLALWALVQFFFLHDLAGERIRHPMLNTNNLAVLLVLSMFPALLWFTRARGAHVWAAGFVIILLIMAMLTTQSRGGGLGAVVGGLVFLTTCFPLVRREWRRFIWLAAGIICGVIIIISVVESRGEAIRFIGGGNAASSAHERMLLLGAGLRMMLDHPFPGIGLGAFYMAFPPYRHVDDTSDGFFLHVDPMQFGIETSPLATILFYAFGTAVLLRTIAACRAADADGRVAVILPFCGLLALMINTHVNFDLYMLPALMAAAAMLSMWFLATERVLGPSRMTLSFDNISHRILLIPALVLVFVLAPVWLVRAGIGVYETGLASTAIGRGDLDAAQRHCATARRYGVPSYFRTYYLDGYWRASKLRNEFMMLTATEREDLYNDGISSLSTAMDYNPYYAHALNQMAMLHSMAYPRLDSDGLAKAQKTLERAVALDPLNFESRIGLSKLLMMQGENTKAAAVLDNGRKWQATRMYAPLPYRQTLIELKKNTGQTADIPEITRETMAYIAEMRARQEARMAIDQWVDIKLKQLLQ